MENEQESATRSLTGVGGNCWAIAEGYIPSASTGEGPALESHETACILNAGPVDAKIEVTIFFGDREPVGPYRLRVSARRTAHVRFNDLRDPAPVPRDTDYAALIESSVPIVVQHTRLDTRRPALALLSTIAHPTG